MKYILLVCETLMIFETKEAREAESRANHLPQTEEVEVMVERLKRGETVEGLQFIDATIPQLNRCIGFVTHFAKMAKQMSLTYLKKNPTEIWGADISGAQIATAREIVGMK